MGLTQCLNTNSSILMEGALGERLKREFHLSFDDHIAMAGLVYDANGQNALEAIWQQYIDIARLYHLPFLATTPTRRANKERISLAGKDSAVIQDNIRFLKSLQERSGIEMYAGCLMGCYGDAYTGKGALPRIEAKAFHLWQASLAKEAGADFLYAGIMPTLPEAIGMAEAMADTELPYIISFTIMMDGCLIDGTTIHQAIETLDKEVPMPPLCYMANCVHPTILYKALAQPFNQTELVHSRFLGIQANTSPLPYCELEEAKDLKCSEPKAFADEMLRVKRDMHLIIMGGCFGTDHRHMQAMAKCFL